MPGAWLAAQAKTTGIVLLQSCQSFGVVLVGNFVRQSEGSKQERMNPESVKFPHIDVKDRAFFLFTEFITFDERGGVLPEAFTLRRIAVDVVNEFLQLIKAHIHLANF
jgi:hypothetical protein